MIPKKIHYCWFGGKPLPESAKKYIETWKKYCPDYEIIEWNENNFDVTKNKYCKEAYEAKKWAFVSDYARFWILYKYGGIYFDTDVEVIKPLDDIVAKGPFMGCERDAEKDMVTVKAGSISVNPGLGIGVNSGLGIYKEILNLYDTLDFKNKDGSFNLKTVVQYTTEILAKHGLKNTNQIQYCAGVYIYPREYFCPKNIVTGKLEITDNSYTIHHFEGSWLTPWLRCRHCVKILLTAVFGGKFIKILLKIKNFFREE